MPTDDKEDEMKTYSINPTGLAEIHAFLAGCHKYGGEHFTSDMLRAWAAEAEFQLAEGNPPTVEIKPWAAVSGRSEVYTVSDAGLDAHVVEIEGEK